MAKVIQAGSILGQQGINLIEGVVLRMGFVWRVKAEFDAGIDGEIEIRDPQSGAMSGCILNVQGKARSSFQAETESSFEFPVGANDLDYWLNGNVPNILIVCRPSSNEAYWISIRDYFSNPAARKSGKVRFDKAKHRFDEKAASVLVEFARPKDSGLYFVPPKSGETLYSNLIPVTQLPSDVYVADSELSKRRQVFDVFDHLGVKGHGEFVLRGHRIVSVHELKRPEWTGVCDQATVERISFEEWAGEDVETREADVREMLWHCLDSCLYRLGMKFCAKDECFYFRQPRGREELSTTVQGVEKPAQRALVARYESGKPKQLRGYKHAAFSARFWNFDGDWFLEVTPTNFYTTDGKARKANSAQLRKGIKQIERNHSVFGHVNMWSELLAGTVESDLLRTAYPHLSFGRWKTFECPVAIIDAAWRDGVAAEPSEAEVNQFLLMNL